MVTKYDEKGKIFTTVITKKPIEVIIQTSVHKIIGSVYFRPDHRLIDELNSVDRFLAVTDARIFDMNDKLIHNSNFLTVNIDQILWALPSSELIKDLD